MLKLMLIAWIVEKSKRLLGECRSILLNGFGMEDEEIISMITDIHFWMDALRNDVCNDKRAYLSKSIDDIPGFEMDIRELLEMLNITREGYSAEVGTILWPSKRRRRIVLCDVKKEDVHVIKDTE